MHQQISKKIIIYFFLFVILGTFNNKFLNDLSLPKIKDINIYGLDKNENINFIKKFEIFKTNNLFFIDKIKIDKKIRSNKLIENYSVSKIYPSSLKIVIEKTNFIANIRKDDKIFFVGSNRELIDTNQIIKELPFIFGEFNNKNFFKLKKDIDESLFNYDEIKNLFIFPSGRWDIETKSGILIKLPKERQKDSLNLFTKLIKDEKFNRVKIIDLRQKNQVIINE